MPDKNRSQQTHRICGECHLGHIRSRRITHVHWYDGQIVVVPNVHAEVCDFCGATNPDDDQLWRLDQLLQHGNELKNLGTKPHHTRTM